MPDAPKAQTLTLPRPIAFAFSGGTSLGAIQVGMLQALQERGVAPDLLVGSSVGAINAAFMAGGFEAERIAALAAIWAEVRATDVFGPPGLARLLSILGGIGTLASPGSLRALLERHLPARHSDLAIPAAVIATDLLSGDPVILEDGALRRNVMASAAIPGLFPAVEVAGRTLADGGLAAQVPVLEAVALGAASVVVLDAGYPCALSALPHGPIARVVHAVNIMLRHQSLAALTRVGARATVLYLPSPCPLGVAPWDFTQAASLIERGHRTSARFLATLRAVAPGVHGHPHLHAGRECETAMRLPRAALAVESAEGK
ncbi:MAG TPA: patatin-like phospholipase family protein [Anaeromyxobacteraceae bacterium]|nr:patatin-like phospholipase family protein [Anaeromyxobacteraceae bacterium]